MSNENEFDNIPKEIIGVYKIECNGKCYVGSSSRSIKIRWRNHLRDLSKGKHCNKYLQNVFDKYGENSFIFSVLEIVERPDEVIACEQKHIDVLKPEYNICKVAGSCRGRKFTEETKKKISKSNSGKPLSEETKQKIRKAHLGKTVSEETKEKHRNFVFTDEMKEKISKSKLGKFHTEESKQKMKEIKSHISDETRQKMSKSKLGQLHTEETKRKLKEIKSHISDETRQKMSQAKLLMSEETKQKIRESKLHMSDETREKISKGHTGKKLSDETKQKIREKIKEMWSRKKLLKNLEQETIE